MDNTELRLSANDHQPVMPALWAVARDRLRARREANAARRRLESDLASYTSQTDLNDLYAMLDHHDDADTAVMRDILVRQQWRRRAA
jgi:hypothetical protein